jgi:uncharacterized repeat protein (TIGR01451 family)
MKQSMRGIFTFFGVFVVLICSLQAISPHAFALGPYTTMDVSDLHDANPADGVCEANVGAGNCTLRGAIEQGIADGVPTTINVNSIGVYDLTGGQLTIPALADITLTGPPAPTALPVIGNISTGDRAIEILVGGKLVMKSVIIANVANVAGSGGCVSNNGRLEMDNVELSKCQTSNPGGALATGISSSTLITGSLGTGNFGSSFHDSSGSFGGCVYNKSNDFVVRGLDMTNCKATGDGGAFYNASGANATFEDFPGSPTSSSPRFAESDAAGNGGGIYNAATLTLKNTLVIRNGANDGGGIYNTGVINGSVVTIRENYAKGNGGGIYGNGFVSLVRGAIFKNTSDGLGGGVFHTNNSFILSNFTVADNRSGLAGGGLYIESNGFDIRLSTVWGNGSIANIGKQLFIQAGVQAVAKSSIFSNSLATMNGSESDCSGTGEFILADLNLVRFDTPSDCTYSGPGQSGGIPLLTTYPTISTGIVDNGDVYGPYLDVAAVIPTNGSACAGLLVDQIGNTRRVPQCTIGSIENATVIYVGKISGTVTRQRDGAPIFNICVYARTASGTIYDTRTDSNGDYEIKSLPDADYTVSFVDCANPSAAVYTPEWYNESPNFAGAQVLKIGDGVPIANINGTLTAGGKISGYVYDEVTGLPIEGIKAYVLLFDPVGGFTFLGSTTTDANGFYSIVGVSEGDVFLAFTDDDGLLNGGQYFPEWGDNAAIDQDSPNPITDGASKFRVVYQPVVGDGYPSNDTYNAYLGLTAPVIGNGRMDVSITKTGLGNPVVGQIYTYSFAIKNKTKVEAKGLYIEDTLPEGAAYVSSSIPCTGTPLRCDIPDLAGLGQYNMTVTVKINKGGPLTNSVVAKSTRSIDVFLGDNTSLHQTNVSTILSKTGQSSYQIYLLLGTVILVGLSSCCPAISRE